MIQLFNNHALYFVVGFKIHVTLCYVLMQIDQKICLWGRTLPSLLNAKIGLDYSCGLS